MIIQCSSNTTNNKTHFCLASSSQQCQYHGKVWKQHGRTVKAHHSSAAHNLQLSAYSLSQKAVGASAGHKSPSTAALTLFVQPWTFLTLGPGSRKALWAQGQAGSSGLSQGSTALNNLPGPEVKPLTSAVAGHCREAESEVKPFPPLLPLATQVSEALVLAKGQRS